MWTSPKAEAALRETRYIECGLSQRARVALRETCSIECRPPQKGRAALRETRFLDGVWTVSEGESGLERDMLHGRLRTMSEGERSPKVWGVVSFHGLGNFIS